MLLCYKDNKEAKIGFHNDEKAHLYVGLLADDQRHEPRGSLVCKGPLT